jgi:two-component system response regulator FlrC
MITKMQSAASPSGRAIRSLAGATILVVEDDDNLREALVDTLELAGAEVIESINGIEALEQLETRYIDMIVSDVNMDGMDGHELLEQVQQHWPQIPMLLATAFGSISRSVDAMRRGAVDYLVKPFEPQLLIETILRHVNVGNLKDDAEPVAEETSSKQLLQLAQRVAQTDSTVLICGESGTGKEVLARYIHRHSPRAHAPFIAINCAAIPENMLEAMLFGHEKGAFTGAYASAPGKFEQADGGTLLLDEISEMNIGLQAKLLRVIQEREVERLGGRKTIPLDVRIIATTNRSLQQEVVAGRFREDLFYRLSVFPLMWLPLRERRADILPIAQRLLAYHSDRMRHVKAQFDQSAIDELLGHGWPGNVRELDNVMQRALIMQPGTVIGAQHLRLDPMQLVAQARPQPAAFSISDCDDEESGGLGGEMRQREFEIIIETLKSERGSRKTAAEKLGISPRTLRYKLAKMRESGIDIDEAALY